MDDEMERVLKSLRTSDKQYSEVMICGNGGYTVGRLIVDAALTNHYIQFSIR